MEPTIFKIGDLVWAKMKGYPPWPGVVSGPPANASTTKVKKGGVWVFFFGSKNYSWIENCFIKDFFTYEKDLSTKCKHPQFKLALEAIHRYHENGGGPLDDIEPTEEAFDKLFNLTPNRSQRSSMDRSKSTDSQTPPLEGRNSGSQSPLEKPKSSKRSRTSSTKKDVKSKKSRPSPDAAPVSANGTSMQENKIVYSKTVVKGNKSNVPCDFKIGFLGMGNMGVPLAKVLANSGFKLTIWNRTLEKCEQFNDDTTTMALSPGEVVRNCDVIVSCLKDSEAVFEVLYGNGGVLGEMNSKKTYIEMTSIDAISSSEIEDAIHCRGAKYLAAMISGTISDAEKGQLVMFTSGDEFAYEQSLPLLEAMAKRFVYFGRGDSAVRMNAIVNAQTGIIAASITEGLILAERVGASLPDLMSILKLSPLFSNLMWDRMGAACEPTAEPQIYPLEHMKQNLRGVISFSGGLNQPTPLASVAHETFKKARRYGYLDKDIAYIRSMF